MSERLREGRNIKWDSSTDDEDTYETKFNMRLRDSRRNNLQQPIVSENETVLEPRKRGRGPSKRPCLNRNALMARENRLRKKAYLEKIESKLSFYQQENKNLVNVIRKQTIDIKKLSGEVAYLRSVLNNNTSITALLKTINEGLRKISTQKNNLLYPNHSSEYSNELGTCQKCTCYPSTKESALNGSGNIFMTNVNNDMLQCNKNEISESCIDSRKENSADIKNNPKNQDPLNVITSTTDSVSEDSYDTKDLDNLLPISQVDLPTSNEKKDNDAIGIDFDQLSSFNMDIFEDLPKCDEMMNTVDSLNDTANMFAEDEIATSLDNTGICLHVNSDKVSLEFCSICHLNSKNSGSN